MSLEQISLNEEQFVRAILISYPDKQISVDEMDRFLRLIADPETNPDKYRSLTSALYFIQQKCDLGSGTYNLSPDKKSCIRESLSEPALETFKSSAFYKNNFNPS